MLRVAVASQIHMDALIGSVGWEESAIPGRHLNLALNKVGSIASRTVSGRRLKPLLKAVVLGRVILLLLPSQHLEVTCPIMTSARGETSVMPVLVLVVALLLDQGDQRASEIIF